MSTTVAAAPAGRPGRAKAPSSGPSGRDDGKGQRPGLARTNAGRSLGLLIAVVTLAVCLLGSLAIGARSLPLPDVWNALFAFDGSEAAFIVRDLRVPRALLGLIVGAALGVSGALIQALTRNPLADPGILGVNAGAGFAVTLGIAFLGLTSFEGYLALSFAGAIVVTTAVYALGSAGRAGATPVKLTLVGVALSAVLAGISSAIALLRPDVFDEMRGWAAGSLAARGWDTFWNVLPFITVGLVLALLSARSLNAVALGDDLARSLGASVGRTRVVVVIAVTLLAGAATAAAGPIGFVGLMIPHIARWFVGPDQRWIMLYTMVCAPILLVLSDTVGRIVLSPQELQVGIVTAFIGAPVLILLVRRKKASGL
ncbi:FecCD family ABC transporter permease [Streptomyces albipurpureus]|uniref:Iron chelate uptake ABC transporter family permease subunit n=1 Tax=Streptomyces albipurpureus TaxID=2897419 RepID=A0ABT0UZ45_9ACTN|nr:iron chelate uptake ABC transporter family permease subunit [Streptomyces sp. CWNU-1]MCM2393838.1 iron chelate uptake ABC transporter family permease subunit [Streptomyces sp. CWNU-1]